MKNKDIISINSFSKDEILFILKEALEIKKNPKVDFCLKNKILASCFFEPSTRTRLSFEAAMYRLGGNVIGFSQVEMSSVSKGESLYDTIKVIGNYSDIIIVRHPLEGAAYRASEATEKPVINAGDGSREHPTQTLLDLFSIQESQGTLENLNVAFVGDLKYARTLHSLALACSFFQIRLFFISTFSTMPEDICRTLKEKGVRFSYHSKLEEVISKLDIVYVTRIQKERFESSVEYKKVKDALFINLEMLSKAQKHLRVLHPLPRLKEIGKEIDETPFAYYFNQAENGLFLRQALLKILLQ